MAGDWLSLSEAAKLLGIHPSTLRGWANTGKIPCSRTEGGHRRFKHNDIQLWAKSQNADEYDEFSDVLYSALNKTRFHIQEGVLEKEGWYQKLDTRARERYRLSGRHMLRGLMAYFSTDEVEAENEARALGYEYGSRGRRYGLTTSESVEAFIFFRDRLVDALLEVYENAAIQSPHVWSRMFRKINAFTDKILLTMLESQIGSEKGQKE